MSSSELPIKKQAVGRQGFIGSLYDVRSDRFEGGNLFNRELPSSFITTTDCAFSNYFIDENSSQKDTFNKVNIEASMKVSLLAGLVKLEGSAKYLNQTKTDSRTVRLTSMLQMKTKQEQLQISRADLIDYLSLDALESPNATHCVIGIMWGANVAATFEQILNDSKTAEEIQGELFANFSKATLNISGHAKLENIAQINSQNCALKISFSGDVLIEDIPRTPDDVFRIFQKVPLMLRELNNGKGQQLEFELYPLKRIASNFKRELQIQRIIKDIDIHVMNRIEDTFEQIIKGKRILNDFLDKIEPWRDWLPPHWLQVVDNKRLELAGKQLEIQRRLASLLEKIRRGEAEQNEMIVLLDEFDEKNPCSVLLIKKFLKENSRIEIKIDSLGEFDDSIKEKQPNADLLLKRLESISDIVDQYYVYDVYLLHISSAWQENVKDRENWRRQLRCFNNLRKSTLSNESKKTIFRVIDHDLHTNLTDKPSTCVIYHVKHGEIKTKDYCHTSLIELSLEQIQKIQSETKCSSFTKADIQKRFQEFIKKHPIGELNEKDFTAEFHELFPCLANNSYLCVAFLPLMPTPLRSCSININPNATWVEHGLTVAGGNQYGNRMNQLHDSRGIFVTDDQTIYVADGKNNRIMEWKCGAPSGKVIANEIKKSKKVDRLNKPFDVIIDRETDSLVISDSGNQRVVRWSRRSGGQQETIISDISCTGLGMDENGFLYVADCRKHEVKQYKSDDDEGTVVAGGNGQGSRLDQLNCPSYIFVDQYRAVYVSDNSNHRIMKWEEGAKQGIVIAGGQGTGNSLTQLSWPNGIVVDSSGTVYVADCGNHRIVRWSKGVTQGNIIAGGNDAGSRSNQLDNPYGLSFDRHGNIYVTDGCNERVQKFNIH
ncbi:unnamed protein product [Rotaria sp. Silwood1]|nr:unnamed protein product [Rotaria sp. Silwood1]